MHVSFDSAKGILKVAGWRNDHSPAGRVSTHQMEIRHGHFERRVRVFTPVDADRIRASYSKGFIRVVLPKAGGRE